jgi:isoprenylcysteine carboxyl methyltransferase (ICMT) family protein YpbQ
MSSCHPLTPSPRFPARRLDQALDGLERMLVLILYGWLVFRIVKNFAPDNGAVDLLLLLSEGLVVFYFLIRRRALNISRRPVEWLAAMIATCAALLVLPEPGQGLVPLQLAACVLLAGMIIQILAKITLGRSIGCVPAHRGVKVSGPYRFIRHPMYAGYSLSHLAFLAANPSFWNAAIYAVEFALLLYRLGAEERLLSRDPLYADYRRVVRYRLIPGLF